MYRSISPVFSAMLLLGLTLVFGSMLFLQLRGSEALKPEPRPLLAEVTRYNATHKIYYVAEGCLKAPLLVWNVTGWNTGREACRGSLIIASESEVAVFVQGQG